MKLANVTPSGAGDVPSSTSPPVAPPYEPVSIASGCRRRAGAVVQPHAVVRGACLAQRHGHGQVVVAVHGRAIVGLLGRVEHAVAVPVEPQPQPAAVYRRPLHVHPHRGRLAGLQGSDERHAVVGGVIGAGGKARVRRPARPQPQGAAARVPGHAVPARQIAVVPGRRRTLPHRVTLQACSVPVSALASSVMRSRHVPLAALPSSAARRPPAEAAGERRRAGRDSGRRLVVEHRVGVVVARAAVVRRQLHHRGVGMHDVDVQVGIKGMDNRADGHVDIGQAVAIRHAEGALDCAWVGDGLGHVGAGVGGAGQRLRCGRPRSWTRRRRRR